MSSSLPLNLICAWSMLFCFVLAHENHLKMIKHVQISASYQFEKTINISSGFGFLTGLGILVYYFLVSVWYWPILLCIAGMIIGGLLFGLLSGIGIRSGIYDDSILSKIAFISWPISALWAISIIHGIK